MRRLLPAVPLLLLLVIAACQPSPKQLMLQRGDFPVLQGWAPATIDQKPLQAFLHSCKVWHKRPPNAHLKWPAGPVKHWQEVCEKARSFAAQHCTTGTCDTKPFWVKHFDIWRATTHPRTQGLFTGYFEPELRGSLVREGPYQHPIHARPDGWTSNKPPSGKPYYSRKAIDEGALEGKAKILAWVEDPVALFFLHIQGSGRIRLPDDRVMRIGYAGQNGHAYTAIGTLLWKSGAIPRNEVSAHTIRDWLHRHPSKQHAVMHRNASYIFFRVLDIAKGQGPIGAKGVPLTPEASLAIDDAYLPYGLPLWLSTTLPDIPVDASLDHGSKEHWPTKPYQRLMIAQDTGGAILGPVRGDVFFGAGPRAEHLAGLMQQPGRYSLLLPKATSTWLWEQREKRDCALNQPGVCLWFPKK